MIREILFKKECSSRALGRNGYTRQKGIVMYNDGLDICLSPINSKNGYTRAKVYIPKKELQTFIKELQKLI